MALYNRFMPLTQDQRDTLRPLFQALKDEPLEPDDDRYIPIYQHFAEIGSGDPVAILQQTIEWSDSQSLQLFSGFRGSGKSTELRRLKRQLEQQGYLVLLAEALEYLSAAEPIEAADLLLAFAGALGEATEEAIKLLDKSHVIIAPSYWERFKNFLNSEIELRDATVKAGAEGSVPGLAKVTTGVDIKFGLKSSPIFRQQIQAFLENRLEKARRETQEFAQDCLDALRTASNDDGKRVVFLFDQLEQLRGSRANEDDVIRSVERFFAAHLNLLELPNFHVVCTVPPWLKFSLPGLVYPVLLPSVRLWDNDKERTRNTEGCRQLRELVLHRFGPFGYRLVFGDDDADGRNMYLDPLIDACGGHFRDLLLLLRAVLLRTQSLPTGEAEVTHAVTSVRESFSISEEDSIWLDRIAKTRDTALPDVDGKSVARLSRFLDTHLVVFFANREDGEEWYDLHPLVRDHVEQITGRRNIPLS